MEANEPVNQDEGKTIRFSIPIKSTSITKQGWGRRQARKVHVQLNRRAPDLLAQRRRRQKIEEKWSRRIQRRREQKQDATKVTTSSNTTANEAPTAVVDSAATSTCIHKRNEKDVIQTGKRSMKVFTCANGTISDAGQQIKLHHNLREPSNFGDTVPSLARDYFSASAN